MITRLDLTDFTLFARADFQFGALNVIHGANSSGKTHLLKLAYCVTSAITPRPNEPVSGQPTKTRLEPALGAKLAAVFRPDQGKVGRLTRRVQRTKRSEVRVTLKDAGNLNFSFSTRSDRAVATSEVPTAWLDQAPIYFPTRELLSVYPGFISLYETQAVPFDETWRDTCLLLGAPIARGPKKREIAELLQPLEEAIGCRAVLEGDRFFLQMQQPNAKVEADLVAEGYRKLSMVARLIANGSLDDRGYLFWDEPAANLNARLVRKLAPLFIDLADGGVQVFVATHSRFLMREIEIERASRKKKASVRYIGLHPSSGGVEVAQGQSVGDSGDITGNGIDTRGLKCY